MISNGSAQTFLFTFRCNEEAHGEPSVEAFVEQLAGYDPSAAEGAYKRAWFGTESALTAMLETLGFSAFDVEGVLGALRSHRGADRRLVVAPDQLHTAGFREIV